MRTVFGFPELSQAKGQFDAVNPAQYLEQQGNPVVESDVEAVVTARGSGSAFRCSWGGRSVVSLSSCVVASLALVPR